MLLADLDGTVLSSDGAVSPQTADALRRLKAAGWRVIIATGRGWRTTAPAVEAIGIGEPVICATGALVKEADGTTTACVPIPLPTLGRLAETIHEAGQTFFVHLDEPDGRPDALMVRGPAVSPESELFLSRAAWSTEMPAGQTLEALHERCIEVSIWASAEELARCGRAVTQALGADVRTVTIFAPNVALTVFEIFARGVSKWATAERLARQWGIATRDIVAVGDDVNDLEMIRGAGLGVAMGNSVPSVLRAADRVTGSNDGRGLADLADELLA